MPFDTGLRETLVTSLLAGLAQAVMGSKTGLRGSLASGQADQYSDIDLAWEIPDLDFETSLQKLPEILSQIQPVASLRFDPDLQNSQKHRLVFVRFKGVPLFWRLDLEIFARSIQLNQNFDLNNPAARNFENWSWNESALMNGVAALKAYLRGKDSEALQLLERAYQRVGLYQSPLELKAGIINLARHVKMQDAKTVELAEEIEKLVLEIFL
jgi:hypothetical protein